MKRILIVLLAAASLWIAPPAHAENAPSQTFDAIATEISGQPTTVWCETHWWSWLAIGAQYGYDFSWVGGFVLWGGPAVAYVSPRQCETLHALDKRENVGTYHAASAILTLAHEAVHLRGVVDEGETDCAALPLVQGIAVRYFGVPAKVKQTYAARVKGRQVLRSRLVKNPWLTRLQLDAVRWHRAKPVEYHGGC